MFWGGGGVVLTQGTIRVPFFRGLALVCRSMLPPQVLLKELAMLEADWAILVSHMPSPRSSRLFTFLFQSP